MYILHLHILNTKYGKYKTNFKLGTDKVTIYKKLRCLTELY